MTKIAASRLAGMSFRSSMLLRHLPDVRQAIAVVTGRDALLGELRIGRVVVGDDLPFRTDRTGQQLGVVAAGRECIKDVHAGRDARELEHLLRLAACVLLDVSPGPVGTRDRSGNCSGIAQGEVVGRERALHGQRKRHGHDHCERRCQSHGRIPRSVAAVRQARGTAYGRQRSAGRRRTQPTGAVGRAHARVARRSERSPRRPGRSRRSRAG